MVDKEKIKQAIRLFLEGIGEDPDREGLRETPDRIARMWEEFESMRSFDMKLFEEFGEYNEMVLVKDITFYSLCEHHLLPFFGKVHIAYIPDGVICGLSKLVRTVRAFALRPQVQERLTEEIADFLEGELKPKGVAVVMSAEHLCYSEDTEILTDQGWKLFKELNGTEKVAQVYPDTLEIEFTEPVMYHRYPYKGYMINFRNKSLNLLVSPDHKMLFSTDWIFSKSRRENVWLTERADKLLGRTIIVPQAGIMKGKEKEYFEIESEDSVSYYGNTALKTRALKVNANTFLKFLGMYLAEGCVYENPNYRMHKVRIVQKEGYKAELMESVLREMPFKVFKHRRTNGVVEFFINSKALCNFLSPLGKSKDKRLPKEIFNLSPDQKLLFLQYYSLGDGYIKPNGKLHLVSKSKKLMDDIQALLVTIGISTTVYESYTNDQVYYRLETRGDKQGRYKFYSKVRESLKEPYEGYIYSVTVPSGFILVRREGRTAISGNCMSMRGAMSPGHQTVTSALRGVFLKDMKTREEFLKLVR
ncbi:GTP cyclohydrolase I [Hydrogenivirga caldilitoris]|uniref:GTP cyclohydrolase 1 n=2 Tax=Hydrogenivirga caldilitoris TaxID=246264 RepID=A0A497XN72_9AQUI|nr:GTP cyclohydrolase I [Hydrogenivirga caldilitoris]